MGVNGRRWWGFGCGLRDNIEYWISFSLLWECYSSSSSLTFGHCKQTGSITARPVPPSPPPTNSAPWLNTIWRCYAIFLSLARSHAALFIHRFAQLALLPPATFMTYPLGTTKNSLSVVFVVLHCLHTDAIVSLRAMPSPFRSYASTHRTRAHTYFTQINIQKHETFFAYFVRSVLHLPHTKSNS